MSPSKKDLEQWYCKEERTLTEIAEMCGVHPSRIWVIMDVYGIPRRRTGPRLRGPKLDLESVQEIKRRLKEGQTQSEIARDTEISRQMIHLIATGQRWASAEG